VIPQGVRVFLCVEPVDMRLGFDRLAQLARERVGRDPVDGGAVFVFGGRAAGRLKILTLCGAFTRPWPRSEGPRGERSRMRWGTPRSSASPPATTSRLEHESAPTRSACRNCSDQPFTGKCPLKITSRWAPISEAQQRPIQKSPRRNRQLRSARRGTRTPMAVNR